MGRITVGAVALLLSAILAGCAEEAGGSEADPTQEPPKIEATSTTGGIRGVVVDGAVVPIADAKVVIASLEKTTTTDENGGFVFSGLDPGTYFVEASHPLYDKQQSSADVVAGVSDPKAVKIQLNRLINTEPFMETQQMQGFIVCSTNIQFVGYSEECGEGVGLPGSGERVGRSDGSQPQLWFRTSATPVMSMIVEQVWEPSVSLATGNTASFYTRIAANWFCTPFCGGDSFVAVTAESPLYLRADSERIREIEDSRLDGPVTPDTDLSTFTYSGSDNGVILEQNFEQFVSFFYSLEAPEGWSFVAGDRTPYV